MNKSETVGQAGVILSRFELIALPRRYACIQPLDGETGDLSRVFQLKFVFNMCPVSFHRLRAEMQALRNLADVVAFADQFQNLKFAIAKSIDSVGLALRRCDARIL